MRGNVTLIAVLAFAAALFIGASILLWQNRGTEKSIALSLQLFLPLMAGVLLFATELFGTPLGPERTSAHINVLFGGAGVGHVSSVLTGTASRHARGYELMRMGEALEIQNARQQPPLARDQNERPLEARYVRIVEAAFAVWLSERFREHWQVDDQTFRGILGTSGGYRRRAGVSDEVTVIGKQQVVARLSELGGFGGQLMFGDIVLPPNSSFEIARRGGGLRFSINTDFLTLTVIFALRRSGAVANFGGLMGGLNRITGQSQWASVGIEAEFEVSFRPHRKFAADMKEQREWTESLIKDFKRDFDWQGVEGDLFRAITITRG